jgi:restriction endonuclease S subunit
MVLRPKESIIADYLYYLVFSDKFRKSGEVEMRGTAGQKRVTSAFVRNYEFLLPDLGKQNKIVDLINEKTRLIDTTVKKIEQSIEVLKEFKSSLISNVVTGKVKV